MRVVCALGLTIEIFWPGIEVIEQGRFSGIRRADNGDKAGMRRFFSCSFLLHVFIKQQDKRGRFLSLALGMTFGTGG